MNRKLVVLAVLLLGISALAYAQFGVRRGGGGGAFAGAAGQCLVPGYRGTGEEDLPVPRKIAHSGFVYARVRYHLQPFWRGEVPWHHDYPDGDTMFPTSLGRLTTTDTDFNSFQLVDVDSKELFNYPFVYMSEPGLSGSASRGREEPPGIL